MGAMPQVLKVNTDATDHPLSESLIIVNKFS